MAAVAEVGKVARNGPTRATVEATRTAADGSCSRIGSAGGFCGTELVCVAENASSLMTLRTSTARAESDRPEKHRGASSEGAVRSPARP
eukprot:8607106-Alexandrium_andersonii.AAC.1